MMDYQHLCVKFETGVAVLELNRPKKRNALNFEILEEIVSFCEMVRVRDDIQIVLVSGNGPSFSVGFDLMGLAPLLTQGEMPQESQLKDWARLGQKAVNALAELPQITIASVQGHAIGGGFLLMSACDFRIAVNDTRFALPEIEIGLPLTWGGVGRLTQVLGAALTKDLVLTARSFYPADLSPTLFLYKSVSAEEQKQVTQDLVTCLKEKPAPALRFCKQQFLDAAFLEKTHSELDAQLFADAILHPDFLPTAMGYVQRLTASKTDP